MYTTETETNCTPRNSFVHDSYKQLDTACNTESLLVLCKAETILRLTSHKIDDN